MALVALLFAHHAMAGSTEPRAVIAVAGLTTLERQAVLARRLGAKRLFVVAERMPPGLAAALDRLQELVEVIRDPAALAATIADGDRVLTLEEGLIVDETDARRLVEVGGSALAVKTGEPPYDGAERLDSASFWAGLAVYDGRLVRAVAADLGEWDLQSTLLRSATGEGTAKVEPVVGGLPASWRFIAESGAAGAIDEQLIADGAPVSASWPSRHLYPPIGRLAVRAALPTRVTGLALALTAAMVGVLAAFAFAIGWPSVGLGLAIIAPPVADIGAWLGRVRLEPAQPWVESAFDYAIEPGWYLGLAAYLAVEGLGIGAWAFASTLIAFRLAGIRQQRMLARLGSSTAEAKRGRWLELLAAGRDTLPWALLPFALAGAWGAGLVTLAIYGAASFFVWQSQLFARVTEIAGPKL
jgi:1L-myo-inositol 1-phosphate cytidylyltransferase / CDP-L-myo-inositol myo-inositolphosphotransferase